jgi:hypothetical protein
VEKVERETESARLAAATRQTLGVGSAVQALGILVVAFAAGSIPFSYLAARRTQGVDLRRVGTGTVSGTSLY